MKSRLNRLMIFGAIFTAGLVVGALLLQAFIKRTGALPGRFEATAVPLKHQGRLTLFIMAGQSNMSGRGTLDKGVDFPKLLRGRAFVFANNYRWRSAQPPLDNPAGQVDLISLDPTPGLGPGPSFAAAWLKAKPGRALGLIPCARGSSVMAQWLPSRSEDTLYGSCLKRARAASLMGEIRGILFFQGEWDALDPEVLQGPFRGTVDPDKWAPRFTRFARAWRRDLNNARLPIIFAQLGDQRDPKKYIHWSRIQSIQANLRLPGVAMIRTAGLPLRDKVHFSAIGQREIGRRFARAYLETAAERPSP